MEDMTLSSDDSTLGPEQAAQLAARLDDVLARLDAAAEGTGRDSREITLLLATKTRRPAEIALAVQLLRERGRTVAVGENRAQEISKHADPLLADNGVPRHFIGRLQTNKARDVVAFAETIHSVDRDGIADALERRAEKAGVQRDVLVQVNTSGEESKGGFAPTAEAIAPMVQRLLASPVLRPVGLMTGYEGDEERTAEATAGGYYRTGDIGARDADGYITYVGRADDVFKASDYKISPFELESALLEHEAVECVGVVGIHDTIHGENVRAYLVFRAEVKRPTTQELIEFSRARVGYKAPDEIIVLDEMPVNAVGKVDRAALAQLADAAVNRHLT